MLFYFVSI
jgi:peptidoglycan-N-acetylglucosamine deacetylase